MWLFIVVNTFVVNYVRLSHGVGTPDVDQEVFFWR